ncbi:alpha/beta fold hydrolase [Methylobacterium indicum]|uniref:AB hydrolase-1 domain-containing protein n=1 Tax=Methylobacterium indicum TaxID=1775910 RepID=A0A8H8WNX6_9HYPH|nr:alpha/beta hydrolase [Methylobacterium indicum]BCM81654.1 hypothetical protein mvi_01150 [Methylobacterium indicum]
MSHHTIERRFVPTRTGVIHVATCGSGLPVLLLHQTPRSWDEYRDVLPLLGGQVRALAMDTPGFGDSPALSGVAPSIEAWADAVIALMEALDLPECCLVGHHTGAVVALEATVRAPGRVAALVLSSCPMVDAPRRAHHAAKTPIDMVNPDGEGNHLLQLWRGRQPFYPPEMPALLDRFMVDALRAGPMAAEGHRVVNRYHMEERIGLVRAPTLVIGATDDPHAFPAVPRIATAIPHAEVTEIAGGTVPLPDALPAPFSEAILQFLHARELLASAD